MTQCSKDLYYKCSGLRNESCSTKIAIIMMSQVLFFWKAYTCGKNSLLTTIFTMLPC